MSNVSRTAASRVLAWLRSQHGVCSQQVEIGFEEHSGGVGLVAARAAAAGDVLLSVPAACWQPLSARAARSALPAAVVERVDASVAALGAGGGSLADAALLAAALASRPPHLSSVLSYLDELPQPDVPLLWPAALRTALCHGSSVGPAVESQLSVSGHLHDALSEALAHAGASPPADVRSFRWAQAVLLSRAHSGEGKPLALVPGLDLLNHGGDRAGALVRCTADGGGGMGGAFELVAARAHAAGEPLLIDYGLRASHRLVRLYGFLPPENQRGATEGAAAEAARSGHSLAAGEQVLLSLLPSPSELAGAPAAVHDAVQHHRHTLRSCGIPGTTLRLDVDSGGSVALPAALAAALPAADGEGARQGAGASPQRRETAQAALHVLRAAVQTQMGRQRAGLEACDAVQRAAAAAATSSADDSARRRAVLCEQLLRNESRVLAAAAAELDALAARVAI